MPSWTIFLGGEPAVRVQADTIMQAAAKFVEDEYPQHDGKHLLAKLYQNSQELYVEVETLRFRVKPYRKVAA